MDSVNVRNLEQIQEQDPRRGSRFGTAVLAAVGGGAVVIALVMSARRQGPPAQSEADPLAALVAEQKAKGSQSSDKLEGKDVSFPGVLSDEDSPTTALAAVKDERGKLIEQQPPPLVLPPGSPTQPPPASDRLPVVPLPAGTLLGMTPITTSPNDPLTSMAADAAKLPDDAQMAPMGSDGGYQIQVASFKKAEDADVFVAELRKRGHKAYRQAAYVQDRGLWHRVRIGPFKTKFEADQYRATFEKAERISPFVVDPFKVKQAEETRAAKGAARVKKYGRE